MTPAGMPPNAIPGSPGIGVSIVLVTCNSAGVLPGFLESLTSSPPRDGWEIIVVDNASSDGSSTLAQEHFPSGIVIRNDRNEGFASAVNAAAARARGEFLLLANPDVAWDDGTIDRLIDFIRAHPRAAAVAPRLIFPDGRPQPSARRFPTHANIWFSRRSPWRWLAGVGRSRPAYTVADPAIPAQIEAVAAAFLCMRAEAFRAVGGMDTAYFLYVEDTDLCRRWADTGWEVWLDPGVVVRHVWHGGGEYDRALRRHHRAGIRRYFAVHHADQPVRNAFLSAGLTLASWWDDPLALLRRWGR